MTRTQNQYKKLSDEEEEYPICFDSDSKFVQSFNSQHEYCVICESLHNTSDLHKRRFNHHHGPKNKPKDVEMHETSCGRFYYPAIEIPLIVLGGVIVIPVVASIQLASMIIASPFSIASSIEQKQTVIHGFFFRYVKDRFYSI